METPGHTPESISVLVFEHAGDAVPYGVRGPPASRDARNPSGSFTWNREHRTRGLGSAPAVTAGARQVGPCRPIGTARGSTSTARSLWVSASPRLRAAGRRWPASCRRTRRRPRRAVAQRERRLLLVRLRSTRGRTGSREARGRASFSAWDQLARTHRMLHVGPPALRDGRRPQVRTPGVTGCFTWNRGSAPRWGSSTGPTWCGRRRPRPTAVGGDFSARVPAGADLDLLSRVLHDGDDWPQIRTLGPAGCARRSRGTCRRCSAASTPRASKPWGSPGCADRGRAPRLMPAGSDTQPTRSPLGLQRRSAAAPGDGMPGCFTWNRRQCPARLADPDARPVGVSRGTAGVLGDRCSSTRARQVSRGTAGLQMRSLADVGCRADRVVL